MNADRNYKIVVHNESIDSFKERLEPSWKYLFVEFEPRFDAGEIIEHITRVMKQLRIKRDVRYIFTYKNRCDIKPVCHVKPA